MDWTPEMERIYTDDVISSLDGAPSPMRCVWLIARQRGEEERKELQKCIKELEEENAEMFSLLKQSRNWDSNHCYCLELADDPELLSVCLHCRIAALLNLKEPPSSTEPPVGPI